MTYLPRRPCSHGDRDIRGLRVHCYEWTGSGRIVVLLHGWGDSGETYQFLVDHLPPRRHCIAPDMRGFGRTQWPQEGYWFPDYLADLDALLEQISPDAPVDLVGHSMGGNIAMLYAGVRPERVRRLVNLEGFGLPRTQADEAPERYRRWLDEVRSGAPSFLQYPSFERFEHVLRQRNPRIDTERTAFIARAWAHEAEPGRITLRSDPRHKWINPVLYRREEAEACWRAITAPVLLVIGSASKVATRLDGEQQFAQLRTTLRKVRLEVMPDTGHMLHHEQPAALAPLIEHFLAEP